MSPPVTATYRLQFHRGFTFADAQALVPYFAALGVSHLYCSPIFAARPGSTHGYDVVDPTKINAELGGESAFRALAEAARQTGLGLILDIVPNHLAADRHNPSWQETLCLGQSAPSAPIFDIDWRRGRLVLPILGGPPAEAIARGEIRLGFESGYVCARYFDHALPLRPRSAARLLAKAGIAASLAQAWQDLEAEPAGAALTRAKGLVGDLGAGALAGLDLPASELAALLDDQHWRLADWRAGSNELIHRRFFTINDLVGVRVEDPAVFAFMHRLPLALMAQDLVDGLRVDHIDGLADPETYCRRLRAAMPPGALLVVEKILEGDEALRPDWPIDGTTGYDRLRDINGLFIKPSGYDRLEAHLVERGLLAGSREERLIAAKRQILQENFVSELTALAGLAPIEEAGPARLNDAVMALVVHCPVYRSYAGERGHDAADEDVWQLSLAAIERHEPPAVAALAGRLADRLRQNAAPLFAIRLQQLSGPAMAKGLEDTEFYRSLALISANEVGADLAEPACSIERFHARASAALQHRDLVPLATHDTKRGADTRARLDLLSLDPEAFIARTRSWSALTAPLRSARTDAPDGLDQWLIWQTLAGAWPIDAERLCAFLTKAMREAKRHGRWEAPNEAYEAATLAFATALVEAPEAAAFRADLGAYVEALDGAGRLASIAQAILQATLPGIPDLYQGTELWDFSLVDPDNRRPVDRRLRQSLLAATPPPLADDRHGAGKLNGLQKLLELRRRQPELFLEGDYLPLVPAPSPSRWLAFERRWRGAALIVAVPTRLQAPLAPLHLPAAKDRTWTSLWDGRTSRGIPAPDPAWPFVVALMEAEGTTG